MSFYIKVRVNSKLKFNDFNIGVLQRWNKKKNLDCSIRVKYKWGIVSKFSFLSMLRIDKMLYSYCIILLFQWRSPEEMTRGNYISPKIDVYSIGNLLFQILTGAEP